MVQVGNARLDLRELPAGVALHAAPRVADLHAGVLEDQLARQILQRRPGQLAGRLNGPRHVGHRHALRLAGNAKFRARRWLVGSDVAQVALDAHLHVARLALDDGVAHVVPRVRRNGQRQVAVHAGAVGAREAALQIQHAGKARHLLAVAGLPGRLEAADGVGVAQPQLFHRQGDALAIHSPARGGGQVRQLDLRLLEHARKAQCAVLDVHTGLPASRAEVGVDRCAAQARDAGHLLALGIIGGGQRRHRQARKAPAHAPIHRRLQRPIPARVQRIDQSCHRVLAQTLMHAGRQRQARGDLVQRGQIQAFTAQRAAALVAAQRLAVVEAEIAARPGQAISIHELQALGVQRQAPALAAPVDAPGERGKSQRLQLRAKADRHGAQRQIGCGTAQLALGHPRPNPQRALPLAQVHAPVGGQVGVQAQPRHIGVRDIGVDLTAPILPVAGVARKHRLAKLPDEREPLAPTRVRRGVDAHLVAPVAVAHHHLHVAQGHGRRAALLVHPAHLAAAHDEFVLRKKPVRRPRIAGSVARHVDTAHAHAAFGGAHHLQRGLVDDELRQLATHKR